MEGSEMGGVYVWDERLPNYGTRILNGDLTERAGSSSRPSERRSRINSRIFPDEADQLLSGSRDLHTCIAPLHPRPQQFLVVPVERSLHGHGAIRPFPRKSVLLSAFRRCRALSKCRSLDSLRSLGMTASLGVTGTHSSSSSASGRSTSS